MSYTIYRVEDIDRANSTSRGKGAVGKNAITPRYILNNIDKHLSILDFGSGKQSLHSQMLRDNGFENVTAYDFGDNLGTEYHDPYALRRKYDVIFASNVLNTQAHIKMLLDTIETIVQRTKVFICNYPLSPRFMESLTAENIIEYLSFYFSNVERVGGTKQAPLLKCTK